MPTVAIYNQDVVKTGELELAPEVFGVRRNSTILHQVVVAYAANARVAIAHTKTRGEVRGGGKKPWAQKHTGRARHGSTRSPIWVGGGITFGPRSDRNYAKKVNVKVRRQALRMALTDKVVSNRLIVLEDFVPEGAKTKAAGRVLAKVIALAATGRHAPTVLVALPEDRRDVERSLRNLSRVTGVDVRHLNAPEVLQYDILVTTKAGIDGATATCAPKGTPEGKEKPVRTVKRRAGARA